MLAVQAADADRLRAVLERFPALHGRVVLLPAAHGCQRAEAWNLAIEAASGAFVGLLDPGDALSPSALYEVARTLERRSDCDVIYSDEDRIDALGLRHAPRFKPDWSPELLLSQNYIGRLAMMRSEALRLAGGFRSGFPGAEEWDLLLRLSRRGSGFVRVTECLYHRGAQEPRPGPACEQAVVREHCEAVGLVGATVTSSFGGCRAVWPTRGRPLVSIVIPNRNAAAVLGQCLRGLLRATRYPRREVVVVDNGSTEPDVLALYEELARAQAATIVPFDRPFNFSAACNAGAAAARGELLLFLNNDVEVIEPDWLEELVRWAQRPEVGVVGAKLLYPDGSIQHAGVVFGLGLVGHLFAGGSERTSGPFGSPACYRNFLAVTGACQMMRREVFDRIGGYDERFILSFSDVVLCLMAWRFGYRVVYTPFARLIHHESYSRRRQDYQQDIELLARCLAQWGFVEDPYFHPALNATSPVPALRAPFDPEPGQVVRDYLRRLLPDDRGRREAYA
ncbi:MAG TPA: glycosyltransferase family 2 protein [Vicinamibacterales bacterium]|nr:glycosyltransferase family 2 protein [Vicinamibacterales bacterium]